MELFCACTYRCELCMYKYSPIHILICGLQKKTNIWVKMDLLFTFMDPQFCLFCVDYGLTYFEVKSYRYVEHIHIYMFKNFVFYIWTYIWYFWKYQAPWRPGTEKQGTQMGIKLLHVFHGKPESWWHQSMDILSGHLSMQQTASRFLSMGSGLKGTPIMIRRGL